MLLDMVEKLRFINENGELETIKPGDQVKSLMGASGAGVMWIVSLLAILFMFTG